MAVLIIAEHNNQRLNPITLPVVTAASQLSDDIVVLVAGFSCREVAEEAAEVQGVKKVYLADAECYAHGLPENLAELIAMQKDEFSHLLAAATAFGKNLLPRVAALWDVGQVSDVVKIVSPNTFVRPIYAGNAFTTVECRDAIKVLTIRTTAFAAAANQAPAPIETLDARIENVLSEWVSTEQHTSERPDLSVAKIVISGGRGLQSAENFKLLDKIAARLGAAIGASRAAVDAGFAPNDWQVGQTGRVVAPDLYIAVGISGAIQHIAGMKDSKVIVAINKDPDAPIFQVADFGLVGDLFEVLGELERAL